MTVAITAVLKILKITVNMAVKLKLTIKSCEYGRLNIELLQQEIYVVSTVLFV